MVNFFRLSAVRYAAHIRAFLNQPVLMQLIFLKWLKNRELKKWSHFCIYQVRLALQVICISSVFYAQYIKVNSYIFFISMWNDFEHFLPIPQNVYIQLSFLPHISSVYCRDRWMQLLPLSAFFNVCGFCQPLLMSVFTRIYRSTLWSRYSFF